MAAAGMAAGAAGGGDTVLLWLWLLPTALAPVWFGSNTALVWGVHAVLFGAILAACGAAAIAGKRGLAVPLRRLAVPLAALGIVLGWAAVQTVPWTPAAWRPPIWAMAATVVGADLPGAISVYPAAGRVAILWTATAAAVFMLAVQFGREPRRARTILRILAGSGALVAAYGLAVYATGNHGILWLPKRYYLDRLSATFVDPDNFAAYGGVMLVCMLGVSVDAALRPPASGPRLGAAAWLVLSGVGFAVLGAAVWLTGSRAGFAASGLGLAVLSALLLARVTAGRRVVMVLVALAALMLLGLGAELGARIGARLAGLDPDLAGRLALDARVLAAIRHSPWLGYGFGAFEQAFAMFRDVSLPVHSRIEYAHNDWLEALMTLGIPAGSMLWLIFGWMLARCLKGALRHEREMVCPAIAAAALVLAASHSLIDFDMQIQGFALPLLAILGVGVAQSWGPEPGAPVIPGASISD